jgi:uncharacterized protein (TIGR01777 family)
VTARRVVLPGGSGFLGRILARDFAARGDDVVVLTRTPRPDAGGGPVREVPWDGASAGPWERELDGADLVVNLAGRSVDCRYDDANRAEIVASRVDSVAAVGRAIARASRPPRVWIQAGSLAIYGDAEERVCTESTAHGAGFSVDVCERWEAAFEAAPTPATRKVMLRIGLVLGENGGVLAPLVGLTRWFLGGTVGNGRQHLSWLHAADFVSIVRFCAERADASGVYNATGVASATNAEFMHALRGALRRPWSPPTPAFLVRLGARFVLRNEPELALTGRRGFPLRLLREGFTFQHTDLGPALRSVL